MKRELTEKEQFQHGDIVRIVSHTRNCGIDQTVFTAIVVDTKEYGLIAIPQDFQGMMYNAAGKGSAWELEIEWLLDYDVEIYLLERFNELLGVV
ncbi:conjugal transfer protein TraF [Enterococcus ratti]|uniref:Uncharacterized protein n=1 Tax=Enterococcus ratti TaxID=150033 RepID=A0A1L8WPA2_9ENTE|nr:conjugal transfer protein TraF [Enterococcus ratti]OJG82849.1 hypothetical protein RV14_GL002141 [Enterococcus ratti]